MCQALALITLGSPLVSTSQAVLGLGFPIVRGFRQCAPPVPLEQKTPGAAPPLLGRVLAVVACLLITTGLSRPTPLWYARMQHRQ